MGERSPTMGSGGMSSTTAHVACITPYLRGN